MKIKGNFVIFTDSKTQNKITSDAIKQWLEKNKGLTGETGSNDHKPIYTKKITKELVDKIWDNVFK